MTEPQAAGNPCLTLKTDLCVVGGGLAGMLAAVAAARRGCRVVLMHERPMFGGNASSEIRMWPLGCHGRNNRETGLFEELLLENMARNPTRNYSIWDSVLYGLVAGEPNITPLLNCACVGLEMAGPAVIRSVRGWQMTTYTWVTVEAAYFADCSGDSILAPLCGAEYRVGREAAAEFGEDIAPETADAQTMGLSCMIQARDTGAPAPYTPPAWANVYRTDADLNHRGHSMAETLQNFWWIELGGDRDSLRDAESVRDELLRVAFGLWDHIKNRGDHGAETWALEWVGFLPGKRESRRYVGDHILTQGDIRGGGRFDDIVAYGGWTMDDHHPAGLNYPGHPNIHHDAPAPYGIPYRALYSKNIDNLWFAGRNISATHTALSSTRVMATCAVIGQAVGTAAALAARHGLTPRGVYRERLAELQAALRDDDCWLPFTQRTADPMTLSARLSAERPAARLKNLRNGHDRPVGDDDNGARIELGTYVELTLPAPRALRELRVVFDSDLTRESVTGDSVLRAYPTLCNIPYNMEPFGFPQTMVRLFEVSARVGGVWRVVHRGDGNIQRLVKIPLGVTADAVRLTPLTTWGAAAAHIFSIDLR